MSDLVQPVVRQSKRAELRSLREGIPLLSLLRRDVASVRPAWLPFVLVLAAIAGVAYVDHLVVSLSLVYLYTLPLTVGAIFLRKEISYALILTCILFHYFFHSFDSPRHIHLGLRIFHDLSALLCLTFVVYVIQSYIERQESLIKTVQRQRDDLLKDVELAAQVQRLFLPSGKPAITGLEIAGMMHPARGVAGDYYDYFPVDAQTTQIVIADVSGKGVPAALLMSATAASMRLEANRDRNMLDLVGRLNAEIHSVSDDEHYVTLLLAEVDTHKRTLRYVNCGHNPALLFQAETGTLKRMDRLAHRSDYLLTRFANWPQPILLRVMCWFFIPMASPRQRTCLAKNSALSAFSRRCAKVIRCPPRISWSASTTRQQIFAATISTMTQPFSLSNAISTAPRP